MFILIYMTMSGSLNNSYSSWLYLFLHTPFSYTLLRLKWYHTLKLKLYFQQ
jgi:hypothetical protein